MRQISNTKLVVDAHSVFHNLTFSKSDTSYGGDYDQIAALTDEFLNNLHRCNIQPVFVYIGTHEGASHDRLLDRNDDRIKKVIKYFEDGGIQYVGNQLFPILGRIAFNNVLLDHQVEQVTVDKAGEVRQMVGLANKLKCPLLSGSTDFMVCNLEHGMVYCFDMKYLQFNRGSWMWAPFYDVRKFIQYHHLTGMRDVALLGAVLDYIRVNHSIADIPPPKGQSFQRVTTVVNMIQQTKAASLDDLITELIQYINQEDDADADEDDDDKTRQELQKSMEHNLDGDSSRLYDFLTGEDEETCAGSDVTSYGGRELPVWFRLAWRKGDMPRYPCSVLITRAVNLPCQMEDPNSPSSYDCSQTVRKVTYGILISYDVDDQCVLAACNRPTEFHRMNDKATHHQVNPIFELDGFGRVPSLADVPAMPEAERRRLILAALSVQEQQLVPIADLPSDVQLLAAICRFWVRNARPSNQHVNALLLCVLKLRVITPLNNGQDSDVLHTWVRKGTNQRQIRSVNRNLIRSGRIPNALSRSADRAQLQHAFCQWQACVLDALHLNQLLQRPFDDPRPERCFNATLAYVYLNELRDETTTVDFALAESGNIRQLYDRLLSICNED